MWAKYVSPWNAFCSKGCNSEIHIDHLCSDVTDHIWKSRQTKLVPLQLSSIVYGVHYTKAFLSLLKGKLYFLSKQSKLNHMDIEDMEQTMWLKVFSCLEAFNSQYRFWAWMRVFIRNAYYTTLRYRRRNLLCQKSISQSSLIGNRSMSKIIPRKGTQ